MTTVVSTGTRKPLGGRSYGHIPHLPGSRMGPGDHHCHAGQARICTEEVRDVRDRVIVQEKLDGSCVAAARIDGRILALTRAGYLATTSPYEQHKFWDAWVRVHEARFMAILSDGERLCGEWLAQAHGTRYELPHEPFVAFDLMAGGKRASFDNFTDRVAGRFVTPRTLSVGPPRSIEWVTELIAESGHGALDPVEGAVWRVERAAKKGGAYAVDFLAKWVRPTKQDGCYLPEVTGQPPVYQWRPETIGGAP